MQNKIFLCILEQEKCYILNKTGSRQWNYFLRSVSVWILTNVDLGSQPTLSPLQCIHGMRVYKSKPIKRLGAVSINCSWYWFIPHLETKTKQRGMWNRVINDAFYKFSKLWEKKPLVFRAFEIPKTRTFFIEHYIILVYLFFFKYMFLKYYYSKNPLSDIYYFNFI